MINPQREYGRSCTCALGDRRCTRGPRQSKSQVTAEGGMPSIMAICGVVVPDVTHLCYFVKVHMSPLHSMCY